MDVIVKVSLLPVGADKPPTIRVTQGWLRVSHRAENSELAAEIRVSQLQNSLEAVDSSKTFVTWSKRNSAATLFMASLSKMLAKPAVHEGGQTR